MATYVKETFAQLVELFSLWTVLCVQDVSLHHNKSINAKILKKKNIDTTNKSSDVSAGNCDHLLQGNLQKASFNLQKAWRLREVF